MQQTYSVREPDVVAEVVDGEAIIMDLKTGKYFSSDGTGSYCWSALAAGHTGAEIVERLVEAGDADPAIVAAAVEKFVEELQRHHLIAPAEPATETGSLGTHPTGNFQAPVIHVYSDMQELLLLDPIHDVDPPVGWPAPKSDL